MFYFMVQTVTIANLVIIVGFRVPVSATMTITVESGGDY